jgi:ABC-2 type transport system ATP-binding protein
VQARVPANKRRTGHVYADVGGGPPVIVLRDLVKEYRSFGRRLRAVDGVALEVRRGEVFGLLGANGAGKTTILKVLLGLAAPTSGTVLLRGRDPRLSDARSRVGYLPEGHRFPSYLSGSATLRLFGRLAGVGEETLRTRIPALLDLVGLGERGADRVGRYSKGMIQRLGLAAALVDDPEVLLLDEPTDGVDPVGRRHIRDVLLEARSGGSTIFINSHLLSEVERTCDRVCILDRGSVVREGSVADLTRITRRFTLRLADGVVPDLGVLQVEGASVAAVDGHLEVAVEDLETLNRLIDRVRQTGLLISEVTPQRSDLEDVFIDVLSATEGTREGHGHAEPRAPGPDPGEEVGR